MEKEMTQNKMGTMPVGKLMLQMGIPMILSMMLQAVYNIVDSYFVSRMPDTETLAGAGEMAVNALTLAFPVQMLMVAIGIGTGVGTNVLLARTLGEGKKEKVGKVAGNSYVLGAIIYLVFLLFGIFGTKAYIASQTKDAVILEMGTEYLRICCCVSMGIIFFSIFEKLLQATGKTVYSTIAQIAGAIVNIILDPIMIYGLFGCPQFRVKGAAYATVIGQLVSFIVAAIFHFVLNKEVTFKLHYLKLEKKIVSQIYAIGVPVIIAQAVMSVMTYGINIIFGTISSSYVTAYGIFYGMLYTFIIMLVCFVGLEIFANPFAGIFALSGETEKLCITAMRVVSISFLFAGVNIAFQGIFQALCCGMQSLILSLLRQLIFVLPIAWLFARYANSMVWITFIIAEAATALIGYFMYRRTSKTLVL